MDPNVIDKARVLYRKKFDDEDRTVMVIEENKRFDEDIHRYITIAIKSVGSIALLFSNHSIHDTLINSLKFSVSNDIDVHPLSKAYMCLKRYFSIIVLQPWKPEFKKLKTYGGFYMTNVKSVLKNADSIFLAAGFEEDCSNILVYPSYAVDKIKLLDVSFECYVASEICTRISNHHRELKRVGGTLHDAVLDIVRITLPKDSSHDRSNLNGNFQELLITPSSGVVKGDLLPNNLGTENKVHNSSEVVTRNASMNGMGNDKSRSHHKTVIYSSQPSTLYDSNTRKQNPEETLVNFKYKQNTDHYPIPYIDEVEHHPKLSQATTEEHMREGLKLVSEQSQQPMSNNVKCNNHSTVSFSNPSSATSYPPRVRVQPSDTFLHPNKQLPNMEFFNDEGVGPDIPFATPFDGSALTNCTLMTNTNINKSANSDSAYATGSTYATNPSASSQSHSNDMFSDTIYHPPNTSDSNRFIATHPHSSSNYSIPPPIPSRRLKPPLSSIPKPMLITVSEDSYEVPLDCDKIRCTQPNQVGIPPLKANVPQLGGFNFDNQKLKSPHSMIQMKSNSLKSTEKKLVLDNRVVKSMDYTTKQWKCPRCDLLNSGFDSVCGGCSTQNKTDEKLPDGLPVKSCPKCTFHNSLNARICELCEQLLPEELNFVPSGNIDE